MNVGIGFVTGRKGFKNLTRTYISNWNEHGLIADASLNINLFIAYDLKYNDTKRKEYNIRSHGFSKHVNGIDYYGPTRIQEESRVLMNEGVLSKHETELIFGEGYGKKRNAVLYAATRNKMDALLFIDDDEYPLAVSYDQSLFWSGQGVLSTHLANIEQADITHGRHCGYISPIPYIEFNNILTEEIFKKFISAISNDIIDWDSLKRTLFHNKGVTYADLNVINEKPVYEVSETKGMKFISGANLCFNINNIQKIAPFYNPPGARGEDTFLSTCLADNTVLKVPCYTFHDGFLFYTNILNGVLPVQLSPILADTKTVLNRFVNATRGWIRYKPLLTYITARKDYKYIINEMMTYLNYSIPSLCQYYNNNDFKKIFHDFKVFTNNVSRDFDTFEETKIAWRKAITWAKNNTF